MKITYPEALVEKCLRQEAPGGVGCRVMMAIPTVVAPGAPFGATVSLLDANAMPVIADGETVVLVNGDGSEVPVSFPEGRSAVCRVAGLVQNATGFFRVVARFNDETFVSNPALATADKRAPILWGDPHIHTTVGDCHPERCRTRNLAYSAARYAYGLDFVSIADHVSWAPRGTAGKWYDNLAACELYNDPGVFSTLYCYETSMRGGKGGDCNIYLKEPNRSYVDPWPDDLNIAGLCDRIEGEFIAIPHHTTRTGKHGEIPSEAYPGEQRLPVVEIHSKWGTSEYRGNPTPLLKVHPGPSYAQDLLAQGYRLGFVGGTDSHTSLTFCRWLETEAHRAQPGLCAVVATENRRDAIWQAIQTRHCYAACGERIFLDVQCNDMRMGQTGALPAPGTVRIRAAFAAESSIAEVAVIRNGAVVHRIRPDDWQGTLDWTDTAVDQADPIADAESGDPMVYYYVRVTAQADARAWSSPCWVVVENPRETY